MTFHAIELQDPNRSQQSGFQEFARKWRQQECESIINKLRNTKNTHYCVLMAHHADDQVETLLLKLLRGVHISNLSPVIQAYY